MKPNMIKKWSIALLVAAGATGLTGCEGMRVDEGASTATNNGNIQVSPNGAALKANLSGTVVDDFGVLIVLCVLVFACPGVSLSATNAQHVLVCRLDEPSAAVGLFQPPSLRTVLCL